MSDMSKIVEFPEAQAEAAKADAAEFRTKGSNAGFSPKWQFHRESHHFDAGEAMFVARQLEHVRAGVQAVQYTNLMYDRLLPINRSVPGGKNEYTIRIMDVVGEAKVIDELSDDIPDVEAKVSEKSMRFFTIGIAYKYGLQEIRSAMAEGISLPATKAMIARQQVERKVNDIALLGTANGIANGAPATEGLLTLTASGVHSASVSVGGSGATVLGDGKSADEIMGDLHTMMSTPFTATKGIYSVNTLLLPLTTRTYLASRRVGDGTNGSVLSYFVGSDPFLSSEGDVIGMWELESSSAAGAGAAWSGKRAVAYRRDPSAMELMISQDFEQVSPQAVNFYVKTLCRMRLGGLALYQPLTWIKMDGV